MFRNLMGKAGFARIQDRSGRIQVYINKKNIGDEAFAVWKKLDVGDHIHVRGGFMRTRTGEATIAAQSLALAGKCIASMPDKHKGITDIEFKSRQRYVDLFMDPDSAETFRRRSGVRYTASFSMSEIISRLKHP